MSAYSYSSTNKSLSAIVAEKEAQRQKQVAKDIKKKDSEDDLKEFKPFKAYPAVDPEITQLDKPDMVRQTFEKIPGMSPLHPISTKIEGVVMPPGNKSGVVVNFMTNNFTYSKVDGLAIAEQDNPELLKTITGKALMKDVRQFCRTHYMGNGTINGLIKRMKDQITSKPTAVITQDKFEQICAMLPQYSTPKLSGDGATVMGISPEMNMEAAAGAPYFLPGVKFKDVIEDVVLLAEKYLVILKEKGATGLNQYFIDEKDPHMHEMVALLCPKKDVYERNEYWTKVRPFGVFPAALRILFACLTTAIKPQMKNFLVDPTSISALGMSWTEGGARSLLDYFSHKLDIPGYYPLSWGDDQLILVVAEDHSAILMNPDVKGMDMKIDKNKFDLYKMWMLSYFAGKPLNYDSREKIREIRKQIPVENLDNKWMSCINFFHHYLCNTPVLYYKQYIALKMRGLLSGINATTLIDELASAAINVELKTVPIPATFNPKTIAKYRSDIMKKATDIGFPFKEEETHIQLFSLPDKKIPLPNLVEGDKLVRLPKEEVIGLKFLGQKIARFTFPKEVTDDGKPMSIFVPKTDQVPLLAGCALKIPDEKDSNIRAGLLMCGILGRGFNAITDENSYKYLRSLYNRHVSMNHHTIAQPQSVDVGFEYLPLAEACMAAEYPSIYWFAKVYATEEERKNLTKVTLTMKSEKAVSSTTDKVNDSYAKMAMVGEDLGGEVELQEHPKLQGTRIRHALELVQDDLEDIADGPLSSATMHNPAKAVGKAAVQEPVVPAIRSANFERYKLKFEKVRLQRERLKNLQSRFKGMRTYAGKEEDDEFDDIDDPSAQDEIDEYLRMKNDVQDEEDEEEYRLWEKLHNEDLLRRQLEREEKEERDFRNASDDEETEEEKYYDPWSEGDFANVNKKLGRSAESGH